MTDFPLNERADAFMAAHTVTRVPCPCCRAEAGASCRTLGGVPRDRSPHPSRRRAATTKED